MKIRRRDSAAIIDSLSGGVVPRRGLQHIMVGRADEVRQILTDLDNVKSGASLVKFFIGDFGSGKSFIQGLIKQVGLSNNFVVTNADFTPEKRLYGEGRAIATYTELIKNLSTNTSPEGGALQTIIEMWITNVQQGIATEGDNSDGEKDFSNPVFVERVEKEIVETISKMDELSGGYDFAQILTIYFRSFAEGNNDIQRKALKWLRGEYSTKTEARKDLGVRDIIHDGNFYDYLKAMSQFVKQVGYEGLVINFDEAINLYKITHPQAREKNYETILTMFNDCLQGNLEGLYITFGGTGNFLTNERRGLYSYGALRRRLETNRYETSEFRDLSQPVITLASLKHEDLFVLLQRLRAIHATHHKYEADITDEELKRFIIKEFALPGAEEYTTVGHVVKNFMDALSILHKYPDYDRKKVFGEADGLPAVDDSPAASSIMDRFSST